jgi:DNA gyrase subunit A
MVITYTLGGYIKRVPLSSYRTQRRGGRGKSGMETKEEDIVQKVIVANTHDEVLVFTSIGKVYKMKVYKLPMGAPTSKGRALVNLLNTVENEVISTILVIRKDENLAEKNLVFATSFGNVRRNKFEDFTNIHSGGKRAISLVEGEKLMAVDLCDTKNDVFIATKNGVCNRFSVDALRVFSGRSSNGVRGIKLKSGDDAISMAILDKWEMVDVEERDEYLKNSENLRKLIKKGKLVDGGLVQDRMLTIANNEKFILTVTENGFGKISSSYHYRSTNRGTQGFTNIVITKKNGKVVASFPVGLENHIMMITNTGRIMRCSIEDIRITRRSAQGVILFRLNETEVITSVSKIDETCEGDEND